MKIVITNKEFIYDKSRAQTLHMEIAGVNYTLLFLDCSVFKIAGVEYLGHWHLSDKQAYITIALNQLDPDKCIAHEIAHVLHYHIYNELPIVELEGVARFSELVWSYTIRISSDRGGISRYFRKQRRSFKKNLIYGYFK